ncbi:hypothetical protein OBBRIDRAFT_320796 [Obba rivulosa]|uniref:Uncharacterized protein n=1 Tax=Obba rivulosa TaxID=1052685 RepID=A0A8E2DFW9_9APHY|nr:hypothetical protein OBBRIDRAFT_320796 [Obba rivulosa]
MWGRKWSSVTLLFYFNRWTTFIWVVQNIPLEFLPLATLPVTASATPTSVRLLCFCYTRSGLSSRASEYMPSVAGNGGSPRLFAY